MRAVQYTETGEPSVLHVVDRPIPEPAPDEVVVRIVRAGVNPTDWKFRRGIGLSEPLDGPRVPGMDGAGVVEAVGSGVKTFKGGERVWLWLAADRSDQGTTQEYVAIGAALVAPLPERASYELGASLGIPFITAHRCLTAFEDGPDALAPNALSGRSVLVAGGAGAVGNAAIQLASWAGAFVISTVSSARKGELATAAGADLVIDYRTTDVTEAVRAAAPNGIDIIVEVAPTVNAGIDTSVLREGGTVAIYARDGDGFLPVPIWPAMQANARWQFVLIYTLSADAKRHAVSSITAALRSGVIDAGEHVGLPVHQFALDEAAEAHAAVENGAVGKVLIDIRA